MGQPSSGIRYLKQSLDLYEQLGDKKASEIKIELANLFNDIGQGQRAIALAKEVLESIKPTENYLLEPLAFQAMATGFLLQGELDAAIESYLIAQNLALGQTEVLFNINNYLGTALLKRKDFFKHQASLAEGEGYEDEGKRLKNLAEQDHQSAFTIFISNAELMKKHHFSNLTTIRTYLNAFEITSDRQYLTLAENLLAAIPSSRSKAEFLINLAKFQDNPLSLLEQAKAISESINDYRTQSFALGQIGAYFEQQQQYPLALKFTQKAQLVAQTGETDNSLYRWQWQSGRLYRAIGKQEEALASYRGAIASLQTLRHEIATANLDFQLDVIEEIQPIYRELLSLLLNESDNLNNQQVREILDIRNQLELTTLQGFFGDACLELQQQQESKTQKRLQPNVAKIHYILLQENSYQILELPNGSFRVFSLKIGKADLEGKLMKWREMLLTSRIPRAYEPLSKELYTILMGQVAPFLPLQIKQLVFVSDGLLRNVPLAALMERDQFLIEKYAITYSLGLPLKAKPSSNSYDSIAFGLSVESDYFPPLPFVPEEINAVANILQGREFLDSQFTEKNFKTQIQKNSRIIHIATHAIFSGSAQDSYFQAYDSLISLGELEILLRRSEGLQLLFLSACKTASGNERSVLGLAGVGARVGVPSIVASLWSVRDETTSYIVSDFYLTLRGGASDIDSLRQAQLKMLQLYPHPKFWSSFVIITNNNF
ncbi:CHAT domain-containing protein [Chroococcus sp. FPU101]|uniref:CHAT domain-containing protein n=1 Tax=Chroococcus sp. FPU101 TaxID=1974212 RepID=UPI001A8F2785|nr:CHAT domain-containing protein [Chroococcus sp. FPU101]